MRFPVSERCCADEFGLGESVCMLSDAHTHAHVCHCGVEQVCMHLNVCDGSRLLPPTG